MVDLAKKANCDVIKFQHHLPDEEMLKKFQNQKILIYHYMNFLKYSLKN